MFEELQKLVGKKVIGIKDISSEFRSAFQIHFDDGSFLVVKSDADGYEIEFEGLDISVITP